ncbi:hypothetical protein [Rhizohabitans arisaemae]|uniref:hypothetical protein n=1 Tax=Rhizohabitans arisaemae TaxID=2720610 RepID=UPI0024B238D6|nr:hypothetical protein [Rhizohabitans arisaemae]
MPIEPRSSSSSPLFVIRDRLQPERFVRDAGPEGGTVITHNGGMAGHVALMYSTPDGRTTLTAALNYVDDAASSMAAAFQQATQRLVQEVFGGGQTEPVQ